MLRRLTALEVAVGVAIAIVLAGLVIIEPTIVEAPFENGRTMLFTFGGTVIAAAALVAMLALGVHPVVRITLLVVPFVLVNWWLLSPYFVDQVADDQFATSISSQLAVAASPSVSSSPESTGGDAEELASTNEVGATPSQPLDEIESAHADSDAASDSAATGLASDSETARSQEGGAGGVEAANAAATSDEGVAATGPVLVGAGQFVGLAGHAGVGDAGLFETPDGSLVLRFENFDIDNGPDLEVYLVPGADQASLAPGSIHLGALKGNVGDQNYELPAGTDLPPGVYTALVWCEAFGVEFVGATIAVGA